MKKKFGLKGDITSFLNKRASPKEIEELYHKFKDNDDDLMELFKYEWSNTSGDPTQFNQENQLNLLRNKLGLKNVSKAESKITGPNKKTLKLRQLVKYAAIFVLGFFLALGYIKINHTENLLAINELAPSIVKVEYGSKSVIDLPDGTRVHLNSGSKLVYSSKFGIDNRSVKLIGEGFFDVKKDAQLPFYVSTEDITIKVLGTSFNIKSYPDEDVTETTLVTGKLEIYQNKNDKLPDSKALKLAVLQPNQMASVRKGKIVINNRIVTKSEETIIQPIKAKINVEKLDQPELYTEWRNSVLVFNSESFETILKKMERWYNVDIELNNIEFEKNKFSGKFDKESVQEVLNALQLIEPFHFKIKKNKIIIYRN